MSRSKSPQLKLTILRINLFLFLFFCPFPFPSPGPEPELLQLTRSCFHTSLRRHLSLIAMNVVGVPRNCAQHKHSLICLFVLPSSHSSLLAPSPSFRAYSFFNPLITSTKTDTCSHVRAGHFIPTKPRRQSSASVGASTRQSQIVSRLTQKKLIQKELKARQKEKHLELIRRIQTENLVPVKISLPQKVFSSSSKEPIIRYKRTRTYVPQSYTKSVGAFRNALRQQLLNLYPNLATDPAFGRVMHSVDAFRILVDGDGAQQIDTDIQLQQFFERSNSFHEANNNNNNNNNSMGIETIQLDDNMAQSSDSESVQQQQQQQKQQQAKPAPPCLNIVPVEDIVLKTAPELPRRLAELQPHLAAKFHVMSFYRFIDIKDPEALAMQLKRAWLPYGVVGRVYVAKEGINAQIAVPDRALNDFLHYMQSDKADASPDQSQPIPTNDITQISEQMQMQWSLSDADAYYAIPKEVIGVFLNQDSLVEKQFSPFVDLKVKPREKVLSDGLDQPLDWNQAGPEMTPLEWHEALEKNKTSDQGVMLLDCRNKYESDVGHFEGAQLLETSTFRETWQWLEDNLKDTDKNQPIMTYCTGGIRCVKVNAYLTQKMGFTNVNRLEGGIVSYSRMLRKNPRLKERSQFKGTNYVFDLRIGEKITGDILSRCERCGMVCDIQTDCANETCDRPFAQRHFVQCPECAAEVLGTCSTKCHHEVLEKAKKSEKNLDPNRPFVSRGLRPAEIRKHDQNTEKYCEKFSSNEAQLLTILRKETEKTFPSRAHMTSGPVQGQLLSMVIAMTGAKRILELGTFTGYSALHMATSLGKNGGVIVTVEKDEEVAEFARSNFQASEYANIIELHVGGAEEILENLNHQDIEPFDLVFLDANKKQYINYYETLIGGHLLKKNGIILADNVLFRGLVVALQQENRDFAPASHEETLNQSLRRRRTHSMEATDKIALALHDFNQYVANDPRTEKVILPIRDGITIIRKL